MSLFAKHVCCDISTVSRQVTTLVSIDLMDNVSGPLDGPGLHGFA